MAYRLTNQADIRREFWMTHKDLAAKAMAERTISKDQNKQAADIRQVFCEWIDSLERNGEISETLAFKVTL